MNDFFRNKMVRSRRSRPCCECGNTIRAGEEYNYVAVKDDSGFGTYQTCAPCAEVRNFMSAQDDDLCYAELWTEIGDRGYYERLEGDDGLDYVARLSLRLSERGLAKLLEMYEKWVADEALQ